MTISVRNLPLFYPACKHFSIIGEKNPVDLPDLLISGLLLKGFMKKAGLVISLFIAILNVFRQNNCTLSGYFRDSATGEELPGATFSVNDLPSSDISTNSY